MSKELAVSITPDYRTTCPYCNGALYPAVFTPETAPWICVICHQAWWAAELSEDARKRFRPALCDFGFGPGLAALQELVLTERDEARARGTSVRFDQIQTLPLNLLQRLPKNKQTDFGDLLKVEIKRKGG